MAAAAGRCAVFLSTVAASDRGTPGSTPSTAGDGDPTDGPVALERQQPRSLAEIYRRQDREASMRDVLRQAGAVCDHDFAPRAEGAQAGQAGDDPSPILLSGKADVLLAGRRLDEAETLYRRAEARILADPDAHRAGLVDPRLGLAGVAAAREDRSSALAFLGLAAEALEEAYVDAPLRLARGLRDVARTSRELGFEDQARALEAQAAPASNTPPQG